MTRELREAFAAQRAEIAIARSRTRLARGTEPIEPAFSQAERDWFTRPFSQSERGS